MLTVRDLCFRHAAGNADILKEIGFSLPPGLMTSILGPNGSGKTTQFKCITGIWHPQRGTIRFGDEDLRALSHERRAAVISVVPQDHEPPFLYSVADVVLMGRAAHVSAFAAPSVLDRNKAEEAMEKLGIARLRERPYTNLSGGERQLVLIARALAQEAPILILDEPTSHLDFRNQIVILNKVREIVRQKGLTVLMTLHDPNLAMQFSDRVVLMNGGRILAEDRPETVLTRENLLKMYGIEVSVLSHNGTRIIHPEVSP